MEPTNNYNLDRTLANQYKDIEGWGIDADPANNPTYPMKEYNGADHQRLSYERSAQQPVTMEVFHSNERPGVTRVFGTSVPPMGLSGAIRRYAFKYSENNAKHWLSLMLADRVNVIEGIVADLKQGHIPNIFAERGLGAEWKYNREEAVKKVVIRVAIASAIVAYVICKNKMKKKRLLAE